MRDASFVSPRCSIHCSATVPWPGLPLRRTREPDIALELMSWLPQEGFAIKELRPIVDVVGPRDFVWQWPSTFVDVGLSRLTELGYLTADRAEEIRQMFRRLESDPEARMVTPGVLEILATRL